MKNARSKNKIRYLKQQYYDAETGEEINNFDPKTGNYEIIQKEKIYEEKTWETICYTVVWLKTTGTEQLSLKF